MSTVVKRCRGSEIYVFFPGEGISRIVKCPSLHHEINGSRPHIKNP